MRMYDYYESETQVCYAYVDMDDGFARHYGRPVLYTSHRVIWLTREMAEKLRDDLTEFLNETPA